MIIQLIIDHLIRSRHPTALREKGGRKGRERAGAERGREGEGQREGNGKGGGREREKGGRREREREGGRESEGQREGKGRGWGENERETHAPPLPLTHTAGDREEKATEGDESRRESETGKRGVGVGDV